MSIGPRCRSGLVLTLGAIASLPVFMGQGCPGLQLPGSGPSVTVRSPSIDQTVAAGDLVTIVYDATGSSLTVKSFFDKDGVPNSGDEVTVGNNLASGSNKFTQFPTNGVAPGVYRVGITASNSSGSATTYAAGKVTVAGSAIAVFTSPAADIRVGAGVIVPIRFTLGAGTTDFSYRLFYDTDGIFDNDEITITSGTNTNSSIVESGFDTAGLQPGTYFVGVRITLSAGGSITTSYAGGTVTLVTGAFIQVLSPTVGLVAIPGTQIQVIVAASDPGNNASTIRIFYDPDNTFTNGNDITIATLPVTGSGIIWDTTNVPGGTYFVGAELQNGFIPPQVSYSAGPVTLVGGTTGSLGGGGGTAVLTVTTPLVPTTIIQGKVFRVNWRTNLLPGAGTVTVFREPDLDKDGLPDGTATRVTIGNAGIDASIQFADFDTTGTLGTFFIGATVTPISGAVETDYAAGTLTVRTLIFWVGELNTKRDVEGKVINQSGPFQGGVFRGYNFRDNLGSSMIAADDFDGDGRNEIVLAAQFGKPFLFSQGGRGAGEAYMIYSQALRYRGDFDVNAIGTSSSLPGLIFTGIIPNPFAGNDIDPLGLNRQLAGSSTPYKVDGQVAGRFDTEGLRSITLIPDQDEDGVKELVFGFPWCNSYSLENQVLDGTHPAPLPGLGRLENNGHFLRGGVVIVSSRNPLLNNRLAISRHFDRVLELQEVGQVFNAMFDIVGYGLPATADNCPKAAQIPGGVTGCSATPDGAGDTVIFPCEGFDQDTFFQIDPPRLATARDAADLLIPSGCGDLIDLSQVDPPPGPTDPFFVGGRTPGSLSPGDDAFCSPGTSDAAGCPIPPFGFASFFGFMRIIGTGHYYDWEDTAAPACSPLRMANPREPFGCRIVGQTTTQVTVNTTANRFGSSISASGDFLLIGAPLRTVEQIDVPLLPTASRSQAGEIYMLQLKRPGAPIDQFMWALPSVTDPFDPLLGVIPNDNLPLPHNFIIRDVGYTRCEPRPFGPGTIEFEMSRPFHIVGAAPGDHVGEVTGLHDMNNDGVEDVAVGGPGTNSGRGAVYVIYRRPPEVEGNYLLEKLQVATSDPERLNGLMIIGEPGENLGNAIAGGGALLDDYNDDGRPDLLIGSPNSNPGSGAGAGQVFILFGGKNLLNPSGGSRIADLRAAGDGMLITGANAGDAAGTTIANAGDVNGDGTPDILISAPNASPRFDTDGDGTFTIGMDLDGDNLADDLDNDGTANDLTGAGLVYVVFGGAHLTGTISLNLIGTANLPGIVIVGKKAGDHMGGGRTQPTNPADPESGLLARGVASAGDIDGDARGDLLIGSILADPDGKTDAGEVYLVYGFTP